MIVGSASIRKVSVNSSIEKLGLKEFRSIRKVFEKDHNLHTQEVTVMAVDGPSAATMINFIVAEDYKKFAPKQILPKKEGRNKKKTTESEDE